MSSFASFRLRAFVNSIRQHHRFGLGNFGLLRTGLRVFFFLLRSAITVLAPGVLLWSPAWRRSSTLRIAREAGLWKALVKIERQDDIAIRSYVKVRVRLPRRRRDVS